MPRKAEDKEKNMEKPQPKDNQKHGKEKQQKIKYKIIKVNTKSDNGEDWKRDSLKNKV